MKTKTKRAAKGESTLHKFITDSFDRAEDKPMGVSPWF